MTKPDPTPRQPVPRGIARSGPVVFSYGFRPFFLAAGIWAVAAMGLWVLALAGNIEIGGSYGGAYWHAHEMLFGYSSAALAGFLLTAVPNWTGRLPVSGMPLLVLFTVWLAGRLVLLAPDLVSLPVAIIVDAAFMPFLLAICAREIFFGRKWKDLKVLAGVLALALGNIGFHLLVILGGDAGMANRLAVGAYIMLVAIIGGRVIPSFTRNWLAKQGATQLPIPYNRFDTQVLMLTPFALAFWVFLPETILTTLTCGVAAILHLVRLGRWRGWDTNREKLVLVLHVAYLFMPLGFAFIAMASLGWIEPIAALHVFTVGAIGGMTLAIMSRATRGHTGLPLAASPVTIASYIALFSAAILRPLTSFLPDYTSLLLSLTGLCWMLAFGLYTIEYAPVLLTRWRNRAA